MFTRIVVPLDGSTVAEQALGPASDLAERFSATLHLLRVVDWLAPTEPATLDAWMDGADPEALATERNLASLYLAHTANAYGRIGITMTHEVLEGRAIAEVARRLSAGDLLVLASHGRDCPAHWPMGRVVEALLRDAPAPVLLVRTGKPATAPARPGAG